MSGINPGVSAEVCLFGFNGLTFSLYLEIAATVTWGLGDLSDHECRDAQ